MPTAGWRHALWPFVNIIINIIVVVVLLPPLLLIIIIIIVIIIISTTGRLVRGMLFGVTGLFFFFLLSHYFLFAMGPPDKEGKMGVRCHVTAF